MFGGTFDPPHIGHAVVAYDMVQQLGLDRLLVIPAARPPHRSAFFEPETRLELTRKVFAGVPGIEVDDLEFERAGPSYAVETLSELRRRYEAVDLTLIVGADQLAAIDTWHEFERLPELATIAVMSRRGERPALPDGAPDIPYIAIDVTRIDVSASRIRHRLREGRSIRFLVPESIRTDIERAWADRVRAQQASTEC